MTKSFGSIIAMYRKERHIKQQELADLLERYDIQVKKSAVSSWETGTSQPNASQLFALCEILGITDIYSQFIGPNPEDPFSDLNEAGRQKALEYIQLLIKSGEYSKPCPISLVPDRMIRVYCLPVSAGTGSFLDGEAFDTVKVGSEVPAHADFGVRVTGDSMEPRFINGQIVWVQQAEALEHGEIGIFCLNGSSYLKKLQSDEDGVLLLSLNKKYRPLIIKESDDFRIFGRVIG